MEILFFERLVDYGVMGLWTLFMIYLIIRQQKKEDKQILLQEKREEKLSLIIEKNTQIISKFMERQDNYFKK